MNVNPENKAAGASKCLARSVVDALGTEPALEAVTINRAQQKISLATLGKTDEPRLTENVTGRIQQAYEVGRAEQCLLLHGEGDCLACDTPLSESERQRITIRHEGDITTIARMTCPTAPKFWRWREIPWPKVVQRDVEFLEEAEHIQEHIDEWKPQLAAAATPARSLAMSRGESPVRRLNSPGCGVTITSVPESLSSFIDKPFFSARADKAFIAPASRTTGIFTDDSSFRTSLNISPCASRPGTSGG